MYNTNLIKVKYLNNFKYIIMNNLIKENYYNLYGRQFSFLIKML